MGNELLSRKKFLTLTVTGLAYFATPSILSGQEKKKDRGPALAGELVKEFVVAGHGNLARTREMLEEKPALLNATWDWGGGDFETALGGASHIGSREVAEYLITKGARMDIFSAIMLGQIEIVKSLVNAFPQVLQSKGPHGLTLVHHAKKGGDSAKAVLEYLNSNGLTE